MPYGPPTTINTTSICSWWIYHICETIITRAVRIPAQPNIGMDVKSLFSSLYVSVKNLQEEVCLNHALNLHLKKNQAISHVATVIITVMVTVATWPHRNMGSKATWPTYHVGCKHMATLPCGHVTTCLLSTWLNVVIFLRITIF